MNALCTISSFVINLCPIPVNLFSVKFSGANQSAMLSSNTDYSYQTGTIECWIRTNASSTDYQGIIVKRLTYGLFLYNNQLIVYNWPAGRINTGVALNDDTWHHVAFSFQSGVANASNIYIDGVLKTTTTYNINATNLNAECLGLGAGNSNPPYLQNCNGYIDEVRVWDIALTSSDIATIYNKRIPTTTANLTGYWYMDEGMGSTLKNSVDGGPDFTLYNSPYYVSNVIAPLIN